MPEEKTYQEAPCSVNITCYVKGFKLGFTVRNGDPKELAPKIPSIVEWLEKIGATPTPQIAAPEAAQTAPTAPAKTAPICEKCNTPGEFQTGVNEKGKWQGYKCPKCDKFIKGTFKRVK